MHRWLVAACVLIILCVINFFLLNSKNIQNNNSATRYIPKDNAVILNKVTSRSNFSTPNQLANTKDLTGTLQLAENYFNQLRLTGDSRYVSYIQLLLNPWLKSSSVDHNIVLLQALVYQYQHEFAKSLEQFDRALQLNSEDVRTYYYRAYVYLAMGKPKLAYADCIRSFQLSVLLTISCTSLAESRMGFAQKASEKLFLALQKIEAQTNSSQELGEAFFTLAQIEFQRGQFQSADKNFQQALIYQPNNISILTAYTDLLLHTQKHTAAKAILDKAPTHSYLKVRLAITTQHLERNKNLFNFWKKSKSNVLEKELDEHFTLQNILDDKPLGRDYILYLIEIKKLYDKALTAALKNWTIHQEPEDAYLVLKSAQLSQAPKKSKPVMEWVQKSALEDSRIDDLVSKLSI
ncbi:MAG: tetratricopeptide repeat protein [Pseudomonadota bacterium]